MCFARSGFAVASRCRRKLRDFGGNRDGDLPLLGRLDQLGQAALADDTGARDAVGTDVEQDGLLRLGGSRNCGMLVVAAAQRRELGGNHCALALAEVPAAKIGRDDKGERVDPPFLRIEHFKRHQETACAVDHLDPALLCCIEPIAPVEERQRPVCFLHDDDGAQHAVRLDVGGEFLQRFG
jgi:hypothetical protein